MLKQSDKSTSFSGKKTLDCNGKILNLETPQIMGILNISPDSFYDGGKYQLEDAIIRQADKMFEEGAAILDIGAVSTRPGAIDIDEKEESDRILPALKKIRRKYPGLLISVDTYRPAIAETAISEGADIINDISGGAFDEDILKVVAKHDIPYILMHMQGRPQNMQKDPKYEDVVNEIKQFFLRQTEKLHELGHHKIILDPGFGFGKTVEHNYRILRNLNAFKESGYPVLAGLSRKSMINKVLKTTPETALNGTTVLNTIALLNGADMLRVHDVREAAEAIRLVSKLY